jgi:hypothetical protein
MGNSRLVPWVTLRGSVAAMKFFLVGMIALAIIVLIAVRFYRGRISAEPKAKIARRVPSQMRHS